MTFHRPPLFNHQVYEPRLQSELLALGANQSRPHLSVAVALLMVLTSVAPLNPGLTVPWLMFGVFSATIGFAFRYRYRNCDQRDMTSAELRSGEIFGLIYSATVGLFWGFSSQLMLAGQAEHNLIVTMIYLGVCAGAGAIAIFGLGHLLVGSACSLLLFTSHFPIIFPQRWLFLSVMFLLFHFVIVRMAWERSRIIAANMVLRADKERLLELQLGEVAKANQANLDKSAFLASASHDLRQPVHAVMLLGHALRLRVRDEDSGELVDRILEAGAALSDQFNNLMDLSRLEGGAYRLNPAGVVLDEFLLRVCAPHRQQAAETGITLRLRMDRRLRGQVVYTDPGLLGRILDNWLANAVKFTAGGKQILLTARIRQGSISLGVYDQGRGIPFDQQENIFKPYVQLDNPTRDRAKGIGLGLSIVRQAAGLLGASLQLQSMVGRGSHFELRLTGTAWEPQEDRRLPAARIMPIPGNLQGRRLLLVEDDPMAAAALIAWAQSQGLRVEHHADPATVARSGLIPDLILCDIRLPGERDGIDWLSDWLVNWPDARGLLMSGELLPETHDRAEQEGLLLLTKPVNPDMLLQTLSGLLR